MKDKKLLSLSKILKPSIFTDEQWDLHIQYIANMENIVRTEWEKVENHQDGWASLQMVEELRLHNMFLEQLGKQGQPDEGLMNKVSKTFYSLESLFDVVLSYSERAYWVIVGFDYNLGTIVVRGCEGYIPEDLRILIAIDMYEHARIIDYGFDNKTYVRNILENLNWDVVNSRFQEVLVKSREKVRIIKSFEENDQKLVFGWANVSLTAEGDYPIDYDGHVMDPDVLEKAAYDFVLDFRDMGERHLGLTKGTLVESMMFTKEKMELMGIPEGTLPEGWWIGFHVDDDETFQKIKDGEYSMFSIQGKGSVEELGEGGESDA